MEITHEAFNDEIAALHAKVAALQAELEGAQKSTSADGDGDGNDDGDREQLGDVMHKALADSGTKLQVLLLKSVNELETFVNNALAPHIVRNLYRSLHGHDSAAQAAPPPEPPKLLRKSTRSKFRMPLQQYVGPDPGMASEEYWKKERKWTELMTAIATKNNQTLEDIYKVEHYKSPEAWIDFWDSKDKIKSSIKVGFSPREAEVLTLLYSGSLRAVTTQAAENEEDRYASVTHGVCNAISRRAAAQQAPAPKCYWWLEGRSSLAESDSKWKDIENADSTGWRGITCFGALKMISAQERHYDENGIKFRLGKHWSVQDSPVVCFQSAPSTHGMVLHSAVLANEEEGEYVLPPLVSLEVINVFKTFEFLPGKVMKQKLIVVRPTYMLPVAALNVAAIDTASEESRFEGSRSILAFGKARDHAEGIELVTDSPVMTMQQEWARNDAWRDWKGREYHAETEYDYVMGTAARNHGHGHGNGRDANHDGWTLSRFREEVNGSIGERLKGDEDLRKRLQNLGISKDDVLLTKEEVIAIRLYTGPGYWPINHFLREVFKLGKKWRQKLAQMHTLTYATTVSHLTHGLRKLVRMNDEQQNTLTLFRGQRGELPAEFWHEDSFGCISATDHGFMSTSMQERVTYSFLTGPSNVLWEISCEAETSDGFHSGADVSLLSQYPSEKEILFPPLVVSVNEANCIQT